MNKFKIIFFIAIGLLGITSCEKYLDVKPRTELEQGVLFNNEQGFKDALIGVYIKMKSNASYGGALTQTTIEYLVSSWDVTANTMEQRLGLFNFTDEEVENTLAGIFTQQYSTLASINDILDHIDLNKSAFKDENMRRLIKAECLGLRAYIHLDLLRLYGPLPSDPANGNQLAYVTKFSKEVNQRIGFEEYKSLLLKDLEDAASYSKDIDPITLYTMDQLRSPSVSIGFNPEDTFYAFRYLKMNYYAIKALQARAYLWFGMKDESFAAAKEVIDAKNENGSLKFPLSTSAVYSVKNYNLIGEHIFGLYDFQMFEKYSSRYTSITLRKGTAESTVKNTLYGNTGLDMRESSLWQLITIANGSKGNVIKKYEVVDPKTVTTTTDFKQIPMLRTSEMYLIAAETAPFVEGIEYFKQFRSARSIGNLAVPSTEATLKTEIIKEYRKEFYAEGQAFYTYKRNNSLRAAIIFAPTSAVVNYLIPLPKVETVN